MLHMNRQSGEKSSWRSIAGLGLLVLFAFLLNVAGNNEALAHSAALHHNQIDGAAPAHSQPALSKLQTSRALALVLSSEENWQIDCLGHPVEHDCACCPSDSSLNASAYVRPNDDSVWQDQNRPRQKITQPFSIRFGLNKWALSGSSKRPSVQISHQNNVQTQFVETIRLLL